MEQISSSRHLVCMTEALTQHINLAEVGRRLDAVREASGLEKGLFAQTCSIDASSYSKIIKGEKPLKIEMGFNVSVRWGVSLDYLYKGALNSLPSNLSATIIAILSKQQQ